MELTESNFTLKLQRQELLALQKGINELRLLQAGGKQVFSGKI